MQQVADLKSLPVSEATFADLLKPLIEPGVRLGLAMLHDPQAAEDAVQDASFTAWRKIGQIHDSGCRPANRCSEGTCSRRRNR